MHNNIDTKNNKGTALDSWMEVNVYATLKSISNLKKIPPEDYIITKETVKERNEGYFK